MRKHQLKPTVHSIQAYRDETVYCKHITMYCEHVTLYREHVTLYREHLTMVCEQVQLNKTETDMKNH